MRPKKIILCVEPDEIRLSILSFMLSTNDFRVLAARTAPEAQRLFREHAVDLVLASYELEPGPTGSDLALTMKRAAPHHVPVILLGDEVKMADRMLCAADALLSKKDLCAADLLERIKTMTARKRGPRRAVQRAEAFPAAERRMA